VDHGRGYRVGKTCGGGFQIWPHGKQAATSEEKPTVEEALAPAIRPAPTRVARAVNGSGAGSRAHFSGRPRSSQLSSR
jgi:hypothetical protein